MKTADVDFKYLIDIEEFCYGDNIIQNKNVQLIKGGAISQCFS